MCQFCGHRTSLSICPACGARVEPGPKKCPFCAEEIKPEAVKCRFCGEMINGGSEPVHSQVNLAPAQTESFSKSGIDSETKSPTWDNQRRTTSLGEPDRVLVATGSVVGGILLFLFGLLYFPGNLDTTLAPMGLNWNTCVARVFIPNEVFCGSDVTARFGQTPTDIDGIPIKNGIRHDLGLN